jgi:RNA polymerase sigma-70 factor (ECF subfamily)
MAKIPDDGALDQVTLERLYVKLEKPIYNVVYRWLWNASDAQEVTQQAFLNVWKARERVDVTTIEPLLYRTALNLASNRKRSARLWRWLGIESASEETSDAASTDEALAEARNKARVRAAIEALPDKLREVLMLSEYAELSYGEIATTLGIPLGTVGSRRNTALAKLGEALGEKADE